MELIKRLSSEIIEVVRPLLQSKTRVALIGFPNHSNVGDSAIWLGMKKLCALLSLHVVYECDERTYSKKSLSAAINDGVIFLRGGGCFGDIWHHGQVFYETVIKDFPSHTIIYFPQSIHFKSEKNLDQAKRIFNTHQRLTLLLREERSLEMARKEFSAPSFLCPDMALMLGEIEIEKKVNRRIIFLKRKDIESSVTAPFNEKIFGDQMELVDWIQKGKSVRQRVQGFLTEQLVEHPRKLQNLQKIIAKNYDAIAQAELNRGLGILASGEVVITDRLHGHILSLLLGIPHVVLDNSYGKIKSFYETWTKDSPIAYWADSPHDAFEAAKKLIVDLHMDDRSDLNAHCNDGNPDRYMKVMRA